MRIEYVTMDGCRYTNEQEAHAHEEQLVNAGQVRMLARAAFSEYPDHYEIIVVFQRSISEDEELVKSKWPGLPLKSALVRQLTEELQAAYDGDSSGLAGHFQLLPVIIGLDKFEPQ